MRLILRTALVLATLCYVLAPTAAAAGGRVALSFDDGPDASLTPRLLDILRNAGVTATFCLVGRRVAQYPDIVRRIHAEGHELCNHSWSHPVLTGGNAGSEISKTDAAIRAATGTVPAILRAPYGAQGSVGSCHSGRPFVGWGGTGDTMDWRYRNVGRITSAAVRVHSDEIVLMHDIHATSVAAMPGIIAGLRARGMSFVHASELWKHRCAPRIAGK